MAIERIFARRYVIEDYQVITWQSIFRLLWKDIFFKKETFSIKIFKAKLARNLDSSISNREFRKVAGYRTLKFFVKRVSQTIKASKLRFDIEQFKRIPPFLSQQIESLIDIEIRRITSILNGIGFASVDSREIVNIEDNFDNLNIGKEHPARKDHSFFPINDQQIFRSQVTSSHFSEELYTKFGRNYFSIGRAFRDDKDSTHLNAFYQVEWLIKEKKTFSEFLSLIKTFFETFFDRRIDVYIRPSSFPFTHSSFEIDITMDGEVYEVGGAGFMRPEVTRTEELALWPALAFGLERLMMIKYGFKDINQCYSKIKNAA